MIKLYYGLTIILITTFTGCAGMKNVGLIKSTDSYLYKSGTTNKTMISDYKDCSFKSSGVNQNNQIVNNIGASAARDMNNASSHKFFMDSCFDQKGYELYNERYMQTVKKWDADFYKNSQQGFFWRKMTDDEISAYATDGGTYHYLDA